MAHCETPDFTFRRAVLDQFGCQLSIQLGLFSHRILCNLGQNLLQKVARQKLLTEVGLRERVGWIRVAEGARKGVLLVQVRDFVNVSGRAIGFD